MNPEELIALAQAASTLVGAVAKLRATASASTQAAVDAALAPAGVQFNADVTMAEADLAAAGQA